MGEKKQFYCGSCHTGTSSFVFAHDADSRFPEKTSVKLCEDCAKALIEQMSCKKGNPYLSVPYGELAKFLGRDHG